MYIGPASGRIKYVEVTVNPQSFVRLLFPTDYKTGRDANQCSARVTATTRLTSRSYHNSANDGRNDDDDYC